MEVALVNGERVAPAPGLKGECPFCGKPSQAKCGPIIRWHWAHAGRRHCDPWMENEGPWHRAWKALFPFDWQEVIAYDHAGEKHIADVKRPDGMVIELQNSPMSIEEMESREAFYGERMIWIVNAEKFCSQMYIQEALPDPEAEFVADLIIAQPTGDPKRTNVVIRGDGHSLMFYRRSDVWPDGRPTYQIYSGQSLGDLVMKNYIGHHQCSWLRPREVWKRAKCLVIFDFGGETMWAVCHYGIDRLFCVRRLSKSSLIQSLLNEKEYVLPKKVMPIARYADCRTGFACQ
jgi:competence protein CoiA